MSTIRKSIRINGELFQATFSRKADANLWYQEKLREKQLAKHGLSLPIVEISLSDFYYKWIELRKSRGRSISTLRLDETRVGTYVLSEFSHRKLHSIQQSEWESFLNRLILVRKLSSATRNRYRSIVHKLYEDAIKLKYALSNPISTIDKLQESIEPYDYFESKSECELYLKHAESLNDEFFLFACIALNTGMRIGEILALDKSDVKLDQGYIQIFKSVDSLTFEVHRMTKGKKLRTVGISDSLRRVLSDKLKELHRPNLFQIKNYKWYERNHKKALCLSGLKMIRIHDLRHTFASLYVMNGGTLCELQRILGHSSYRMTERYAHLADKHILQKANTVSLGIEGYKDVTPIHKNFKVL